MTEGAGALPLTTYMGRGPNAPRMWYMLKYLCTRGAVAAVSRYEWWCVLLECICTLSLDPRLLQARAHFNSPVVHISWHQFKEGVCILFAMWMDFHSHLPLLHA